jgi:hypothetical protein
MSLCVVSRSRRRGISIGGGHLRSQPFVDRRTAPEYLAKDVGAAAWRSRRGNIEGTGRKAIKFSDRLRIRFALSINPLGTIRRVRPGAAGNNIGWRGYRVTRRAI